MSISIRQLLTFSALGSTSTVLCLTLKGLAVQTATVETSAPLSQWTPNVFQAIVLGMVQGLTEFIPISSTAHLKVVPELLQWGDPGVTFTGVIQLGSIAAVLWFFWKDLVQLTTGAWQALRSGNYDSQEFRMALGIALGTLPILAMGLLIKAAFNEFYESTVRTLSVIAVVSIVMGSLLGVAERISPHKRDFDNLTLQDGIFMGLAQALALVPGVSRSGSTITAGMFLGLERATAARFSFLLGIPAITLAGLVELKDAVGEMAQVGWMPLIAGLISAAFFSYIAIAWLIRYLQTQSTWVFIWYRIAFGVALLAAIAGGVLKNT